MYMCIRVCHHHHHHPLSSLPLFLASLFLLSLVSAFPIPCMHGWMHACMHVSVIMSTLYATLFFPNYLLVYYPLRAWMLVFILVCMYAWMHACMDIPPFNICCIPPPCMHAYTMYHVPCTTFMSHHVMSCHVMHSYHIPYIPCTTCFHVIYPS
jgi:hypothetical protein